jgi:hypothetical protein
LARKMQLDDPPQLQLQRHGLFRFGAVRTAQHRQFMTSESHP